MTETLGTTRRRTGRPKPIPFTYLSPEEQKEYYELSLMAAPTEAEALNGSLNGYFDTGGYIFSRYPSKLTHPDWRRFRDPDRYTFRTYNRYLAQQATIITHGTETLLASGFLEAMDPSWQQALQYVAAFRYHEGGALRLWQFIQFATAAETISYCGVEECGSRLLTTHTLNRYALDIAANLAGWNDDNALELWLEDDGPLAGAREYIEHALTIQDWAEGVIADTIVAVPLYYEPLLRFFAINGAAHGDASTAAIISAFTALAERRLRWGKELVRLALEVEDNHALISEWLATWTPRAEAALEGLAPLYDEVPRSVLKPASELERARAQFEMAAGEIGLTTLIGAAK